MSCARLKLDRFSYDGKLFREINGCFLPSELGDPLFYSIYLRKIRLNMTYSNLKNFSLFSFEIFRLIHYYMIVQSDFRCFTGTVQMLDLPIISNKCHF